MRHAFAPVLLLVLLAAGCAAPGEDASPERGSAWTLTDTKGETWSAEALDGKPALVFFAATWCEPCRAAAPDLARLHEDYGERVQFLTVGWDTTQSSAHLDSWAREHGHGWPHGTDLQRSVARAVGAEDPGTVAVIGPEGTPVWMGSAGVGEAELRAAVESALAAR